MNTGSTLVTICIPAYNQAHCLGQAVTSALAQDHPALEVVVADDASSDSTPRVLDVLAAELNDPRLRIERSSRNLGRLGNYRRGLYELARGEWMLNLDGDDVLLDPGFVSAALDAAVRHENVVLAAGGYVERRGDVRRTRLPVQEQTFLPGRELFLSWRKRALAHLAVLYHRPTAMAVGFYREEILNSDQESMLRLLLHGNAVLLPRAVGEWRVGQGSASQDLGFEATRQALRCFQGPAALARELGHDRSLIDAWERDMTEKLLADYLHRLLRLLSEGSVAERAVCRRELRALRRHLPLQLPLLGEQRRDAARLAVFKLLGTWCYSRLRSLRARG